MKSDIENWSGETIKGFLALLFVIALVLTDKK